MAYIPCAHVITIAYVTTNRSHWSLNSCTIHRKITYSPRHALKFFQQKGAMFNCILRLQSNGRNTEAALQQDAKPPWVHGHGFIQEEFVNAARDVECTTLRSS